MCFVLLKMMRSPRGLYPSQRPTQLLSFLHSWNSNRNSPKHTMLFPSKERTWHDLDVILLHQVPLLVPVDALPTWSRPCFFRGPPSVSTWALASQPAVYQSTVKLVENRTLLNIFVNSEYDIASTKIPNTKLEKCHQTISESWFDLKSRMWIQTKNLCLGHHKTSRCKADGLAFPPAVAYGCWSKSQVSKPSSK